MEHDAPNSIPRNSPSRQPPPMGRDDQRVSSTGLPPRDSANGLGHSPRKTTASPPPESIEGQPRRGEKQVKPNKVYIGGLPEHTRQEDLQNCFGKLGKIVAVELKLGYGFVEFDTRFAAEESVNKYHGGYFMGNKIRVELSHGGGRTAKYAGEPGACFKCGHQGHWARECPTGPTTRPESDAPAPAPRNGTPHAAPAPREYGRDTYESHGGRYYPPPPRDSRYPDAPPPPGRDYRDYRPSRPLTPPREYRDFPPARGPSTREYDDYRARPVDPAARYDRPYYPPPNPDAPAPGYREPPPSSYPRPVYGAGRDTYDRRAPPPPPPPERYTPYSSPATGPRPRSPPAPGRPLRDEYERPPPPRDYPPSGPPADYRGRMSPRYNDDRARFSRRRSQSPPPPGRSGPYPPSNAQSYPPPYAGDRPPPRDDYRPSERTARA